MGFLGGLLVGGLVGYTIGRVLALRPYRIDDDELGFEVYPARLRVEPVRPGSSETPPAGP